MAYQMGTQSDAREILADIIALVTDNTKMAGAAWTIKHQTENEIIFMAPGDGNDQIYTGIQLNESGNNQWFTLNGMAGFDPNLPFEQQPGCIEEGEYRPTCPFLKGSVMSYWLTANARRILMGYRIGTRYEGMYLGLLRPYALEKQYPYPLVVGGSATGSNWADNSSDHRVFVNPGTSRNDTYTSLRLRRPDGTWRGFVNRNSADAVNSAASSFLWPTYVAPQSLLRNTDGEVALFPVTLYSKTPVDAIGELDGVYWLSAHGLAAEDIITYNGDTYVVLQNVHRTARDEMWGILLK